MNVERVDFGKAERDSARTLTRLLRICEDTEEELRKDPVQLFDSAAEEIGRLAMLIEDAKDALYGEPVSMTYGTVPSYLPDTITVAKRDYERWRACERVLMGDE